MDSHHREALISEIVRRYDLALYNLANGDDEKAAYEAGVVHGIMHTVGVLHGPDNDVYREASMRWKIYHDMINSDDAEATQRDCPRFD